MIDEQQLISASGTGTQGSNQDPQNATQTDSQTAQSGNMQTSINSNSLVNQSTSGIPLYGSALPALNLDQPLPTTTQAASTAPHHSPNLALLGFSGLLIVIAIVLFWTTSRAEKNTTK